MKIIVIVFTGSFFISPAFGQDSGTITTVPFGRPANAIVTQADPSQIVNETPEILLKKTDLPVAGVFVSDKATVITEPSLIKKTTVKVAQPSEIIETDPKHLKKEPEKRK